VIPNGLDHTRFTTGDRAEASAAVARRFGVRPPFFLYVARLEHPAKNHARLIAAFNRFKTKWPSPWQLVLCGSDWHGAEIIHESVRRSPYAADIRRAGFVADADLPLWYRLRRAVFVYPSALRGLRIAAARSDGLWLSGHSRRTAGCESLRSLWQPTATRRSARRRRSRRPAGAPRAGLSRCANTCAWAGARPRTPVRLAEHRRRPPLGRPTGTPRIWWRRPRAAGTPRATTFPLATMHPHRPPLRAHQIAAMPIRLPHERRAVAQPAAIQGHPRRCLLMAGLRICRRPAPRRWAAGTGRARHCAVSARLAPGAHPRCVWVFTHFLSRPIQRILNPARSLPGGAAYPPGEEGTTDLNGSKTLPPTWSLIAHETAEQRCAAELKRVETREEFRAREIEQHHPA